MTLEPVTPSNEAPLLAMMEAFAREMSALSGRPPRVLSDTADYTRRSDYRSCYIVCEGRRAGCAVVREEANGVHYLRHFYIAPEYRGAGRGRRAAAALFAAGRGRWRVSTMEWNRTAVAFWQKVCAQAEGFVAMRRSDGAGPQYEFRMP